MRARSRILIVVLGLALVAAGVAACTPRTPPAPDLTLTVLGGPPLRLRALAGRPVLVVFWATTCAPCVAEVPGLKRLYAGLAPRGLALVAIAMPYDPPNLVYAFSRARRLPYPVALDLDGRAARAFGGVAGVPALFLISPQGRIVWRHLGATDMTALRARILRLLQGHRR